jgi:DNA-binding NtrC family response regulator
VSGTITASGSMEDSLETPVRPWLFQVFRADRPGAPPSRHSLHGVREVQLGRGTPGWRREGQTLHLAVDDARMSSAHARLTPALHRFAIDDLGSRNGTLVNGAKVSRAVLADGDLLEVGHTFFLIRHLPTPAGTREDEEVVLADPPGLATLRPDLAAQMARLRLAAASEEPIVVLGESGTGKELVARAVHALSRRGGELVAVNCGALPEAMVEAELFGHKRGAFSGAVADRAGLVRSSHAGTLFLDELGDLRSSSQAALLRVLQERQVTPVGADRPLPVDLRVVSATHRPLDELTASGAFRADLLARLRGFTMRLAPLRERREDFALVLAGLLARRGVGRIEMSVSAARQLLRHDWPLNVRELDKVLGSALALAAGGPIRREHLPQSVEPGRVAVRDEAEMTGERLVELLREHAGNLAAVARAVGKGRTQVQRWLARFGVDPESFRPPR